MKANRPKHNFSIKVGKKEWILENKDLKVVVLKRSGRLKSIIVKNKRVDLLNGRMAWVEIYDEFRQKIYSELIVPARILKSEIKKEKKTIHLEVMKRFSGADFSVIQDFQMNADHFEWTTALKPDKKTNCSIEIRFHIPYPERPEIPPEDLTRLYKGEVSFNWKLWTSHHEAPFRLPRSSDEIVRNYYRFPYGTHANDGIPIPLITLYNPDIDLGFSIAQPLNKPKGSLTFEVDNCQGMKVTNSNLNLRYNPSATLLFKAHEGDWRPGLGWIFDLYPEYFLPPNKEIYNQEGVQLYALPAEREENIATWAKKIGVKWCELLFIPFFGVYAPEKDPWDFNMMAGKDNPENRLDGLTFSWVNKYIDLLHKYGISAFPYFQMGDCRRSFAKRNFPESIIRNKNGSLRFGFSLFSNPSMRCYEMNPHPELRWHEYIIGQAKKILKRFPKIDGLFIDQLSYRFLDYGGDDGMTAIHNRPCYDTDFSYKKTLENICSFLTKHGKTTFCNGPYNVEIQKYVDGIMAEHGLDQFRKLAYVAIAKPIIYLSAGEKALKACLKYGAFPHAVPGERCYDIPSRHYPYPKEKNIFDKKDLEIYQRYLPLLEYMRGKKWVLTPNPITLPEGIDGNIFETKKGNYVVTLLPKEKSVLDKGEFIKNLTLEVRIKDASKIKGVYLLSVDCQGRRKVSWWRKDKQINISILLHKTVSMILLTKK